MLVMMLLSTDFINTFLVISEDVYFMLIFNVRLNDIMQ
jgi:hypothetical protein